MKWPIYLASKPRWTGGTGRPENRHTSNYIFCWRTQPKAATPNTAPAKSYFFIFGDKLLIRKALEQDEEYFLFAGLTRNRKALDDEAVKRLFTLDGKVLGEALSPAETGITGLLDQKEKAALDRVSRRNADYFEKEAGKLDGWADDLKLGLEREIKDLDKQIKETRRLSVSALTLEEKLRCQKEIKTLETTRNSKRKSLFDAEDDIDRRRDKLIGDIEAKLKVGYTRETLFEVEWGVRGESEKWSLGI